MSRLPSRTAPVPAAGSGTGARQGRVAPVGSAARVPAGGMGASRAAPGPVSRTAASATSTSPVESSYADMYAALAGDDSGPAGVSQPPAGSAAVRTRATPSSTTVPRAQGSIAGRAQVSSRLPAAGGTSRGLGAGARAAVGARARVGAGTSDAPSDAMQLSLPLLGAAAAAAGRQGRSAGASVRARLQAGDVPHDRSVMAMCVARLGEAEHKGSEGGGLPAELYANFHVDPLFGARGGGETTDVCVTASADHSLHVYDVHSGTRVKRLYSKTSGHKDWVTSVDVNRVTGHIASGGQDGIVCVWDAFGSSSEALHLKGHAGPVSVVQWNHHPSAGTSLPGTVLASGGVDGRISLWDVAADRSTASQVRTFAHKSLFSDDRQRSDDLLAESDLGTLGTAVSTLKWVGNVMASGEKRSQSHLAHRYAGRGGAGAAAAASEGGDPASVYIWDVERGKSVEKYSAHSGDVLCLNLFGQTGSGPLAGGSATPEADALFEGTYLPNICISGGSDGYLCIQDLRANKVLSRRRISTGRPGAVTDISLRWVSAGRTHGGAGSTASSAGSVAGAGDLLILLALSDGHVVQVDPRNSFKSSRYYLSLTPAIQEAWSGVSSEPFSAAAPSLPISLSRPYPLSAISISPDSRWLYSASTAGVLFCHAMKSSAASAAAAPTARSAPGTQAQPAAVETVEPRWLFDCGASSKSQGQDAAAAAPASKLAGVALCGVGCVGNAVAVAGDSCNPLFLTPEQ